MTFNNQCIAQYIINAIIIKNRRTYLYNNKSLMKIVN